MSFKPALQCSIPGKVFILGEYAVLAGNSALVAAIGPRFELKQSSELLELGSESPAGRLLKWAAGQGDVTGAMTGKFLDPHQCCGGFGASTAQFALLFMQFMEDHSRMTHEWKSALYLYRKLCEPSSGSLGLTPSGADLVGQWCGGATWYDPKGLKVSDVTSTFEKGRWLVFSASHLPSRKVTTHEHLATLAREGFPASEPELMADLVKLIQDATQALEAQDFKSLGLVLNAYGDRLHREGFEAKATTEDRTALRDLPGVLGVKGTGAMQSDALVLLMDQNASTAQWNEVLECAQKRGLKKIAGGNTNSQDRITDIGVQFA